MRQDSTSDNILNDVLDGDLSAYTGAARWWVGFSGGMDSMVLLQLLANWRNRHPGAPPLCAIHINHQMQEAAADWQERCEAFCAGRGIELQVHRVDVAGSGEVDARDARYAVFEEKVGANEVLFLAHHLDDQVETFFLRLLRGAGVDGLAAMPASRTLGRGTLVRPLLAVSRADIADYAQRHALPFVTDPSNADTAIDRNFLRAEVLPLLATRWPGYRATVARAAAHMRAASGVLAGTVTQPEVCTSITGDCGIALGDLRRGSVEASAMALRDWVRHCRLRAPDRAPLEEFLRQLDTVSAGSAPRLQTGDYTLARFGEGVYLLPAFDSPPPERDIALRPGATCEIAGVGLCGSQRVERAVAPAVAVSSEAEDSGLLLHADDILTLRWRRGGERCRPLGRGGSTTVKKLLQEIGVPPWWRERVPLFYLGDELLAVGDLALCESSRLFSSSAEGAASGAADGAGALWRPLWRREIPAVD